MVHSLTALNRVRGPLSCLFHVSVVSGPIFAGGYLNEFVTKQCKNFTFVDQVFLQYEIQ